ncbi:tetratricopeptide repeat protein, partial [Streptomyces sp. NPDC057705]|uniref:SEL1-like repeat protein n=1 Tax=Streptomyces sp. NPDC057705 TaxID=3346222 RepID=UPI0036AB4787
MPEERTEDVQDRFLADLRRLGDLYQTHLAKTFSQRALGRRTGVTPTTVGSWLNGRGVPQQPETLALLVGCLRQEFAAAGTVLDPRDRSLLDPVAWRERHGQVMLDRARKTGTAVRAAQSAAVLAQQPPPRPDLPDEPRPVMTWTAPQLGVHPAIPGAKGSPTGGSFVLPDYVERAHDQALRARLRTADTEEAGATLVLLRGGSCTGKSRAAFEAVRRCLPHWRLVLPKTAESLQAFLATGGRIPRTVLWLDELQDHVGDHDGEPAAAGLRRLLETPGPLVVVATLWPEYHDLLTTPPRPGLPDPHAHARALLTNVTPIDVPAAFTAADMTVAAMATDSSLVAAAATTSDRRITQTLAAGPDLVDRYEQPVGAGGPYVRAVITAAMDARRFGHGPQLTEEFLAVAAPAYLTDTERAEADPDAWFRDALADARRKAKGVVGPLASAPHPTGMGPLPGIQVLADYLDQHGRSSRRGLFPAQPFWDAVLRHCTAADQAVLARLAEASLRFGIARTLYRRAASAGHTGALCRLGELSESAGDLAKARRLYEQAADAGDPSALYRLAWLHAQASDQEGAERFARGAAALGDTGPLMRVARTWEEAGDVAGAKRLYQEAADAGDQYALRWFTEECERAGDRTGAEGLARRGMAAGDLLALRRLAEMREVSGHGADAARLALEAACAGDRPAPYHIIRRREEKGDWSGAETLYRKLMEAGTHAGAGLAALLCRTGRDRESTALYAQAAASGDTAALLHLTQERAAAGEHEEAVAYARAAAAAGDTIALLWLAKEKGLTDDGPGAEALAREAASAGDTRALSSLALLLEHRGDRRGAERLAVEAAEAGDPLVLRELASVRERNGDLDGAARQYRAAADTGDRTALVEQARLER